MMRVAMLFARSDVVGGTSVIMRNLCAGLEAYGIDATALAGGQGPYLADLQAHGVRYRSLPSLGASINLVRDARAVVELRRALREIKPDLLVCHSSKAGVIGRTAARLMKIPVVYSAHGWSFSKGVSPAQAALRLFIERAVARLLPSPILNVCEHDRNIALELGVGVPERHLVVLNGIPDIEPALRADPGLDPPHLVMIARFEPQKDHGTFISALAQMKDRPWTAELVGDGAGFEEWKLRTRDLGLSDRVTFPGAVARPQERLARAQIFVLTTNWEGLPITILEAMRAGLPTVATDVGGVSEAIDDGRTGFLVPRSDVDAVRAVLEKLMDAPELRLRLGAEARKRYETEFTQDRMLGDVAEVYRKIVSEARTGWNR